MSHVRATSITLYMEKSDSINQSQKLADYTELLATKLYHRSGQDVSIDKIERIRF